MKSFPGANGPNAQRMTTMTFGFFHRLSLLLAEGQASGELAKDFEPIAAAQNVFALYFMALLTWIAGHATLEAALDPVLRDAIALQIRGLRASQRTSAASTIVAATNKSGIDTTGGQPPG